MATRDFYEELGLDRGASAEDIRKAYRKLAREHHPDRNQGDQKAEERFKAVTRAYEVLSDAGRRRVYDDLGMEAEAIDFDPEKARTYQQWARQGAGGGGKGDPSGPDLSDIFGDLFGGGQGFGGFGGFGGPMPRAGADVRTRLHIGFEEAVLGAQRRIQYDRPGDELPCARCGGRGRVMAQRGPMQVQIPCQACGGAGSTSGAGKRVGLDVKIPPGVKDGQTIRLEGQGAPGRSGGPRGDLLIELKVAEHPRFRREDDDLHLDVPLSLREAMYGTEVELVLLDGKKLKLRTPPGVKVGQKLRLSGKGVSGRSGKAGDLYAHLNVVLPKLEDLEDPEVKAAVERIEALYEGPVRPE